MEVAPIVVTVNGEPVGVPEGTTALELVESRGFDVPRIAVEIGGDICPRASLGDRVLRDGDRVEVVSFVGGGRCRPTRGSASPASGAWAPTSP